MTTSESVSEGRFSWVSTGERPPDRPPISYERVRMLIGFTAIAVGGMTFRIVRRKQEDIEEEVKRVL